MIIIIFTALVILMFGVTWLALASLPKEDGDDLEYFYKKRNIGHIVTFIGLLTFLVYYIAL